MWYNSEREIERLTERKRENSTHQDSYLSWDGALDLEVHVYVGLGGDVLEVDGRISGWMEGWLD